MTSAYILIAAILVLGGLIAVIGDRLGSKVGKARLRLFDLRPRQTAIVMTIVTGILISGSTLAILFGFSQSLREGVFELDEILKRRRRAEQELAKVADEKKQVEQALIEAKTEQEKVQGELGQINAKFQKAQQQLNTISRQANTLRQETQKLTQEKKQLLSQKNELDRQIKSLRITTQKLQNQVEERDQTIEDREGQIAIQDQTLKDREQRLATLQTQQKALQNEINQRDQRILDLDQSIALKNRELENREANLADLTEELAYLKREVSLLESYYQNYQELRGKQIALLRGQILAFGAMRVVDPNAALEGIEQLLREANRNAILATQPETSQVTDRVVQITKLEVDQLVNQLKDGRDYVVRILSAENYVQGEKEVRVFADIALNKEIFPENNVIAALSFDGEKLTPEDIQKNLDLLLSAAQFRARRTGVLGEIQVENGQLTTMVDFINQLNESKKDLKEIRAIASETTYTAGPLKLRLVALDQNNILFQTE
jgi:uncharacterized protein (DUF3084 family)